MVKSLTGSKHYHIAIFQFYFLWNLKHLLGLKKKSLVNEKTRIRCDNWFIFYQISHKYQDVYDIWELNHLIAKFYDFDFTIAQNQVFRSGSLNRSLLGHAAI